MRSETNQDDSAIVLLAKGYEGGFVHRCVETLREAGIRTHLIGLQSQLIRSWHGVETKADFTLRQLPLCEKLKLVIIPGRPQCVSMLALEPLVPELIRYVLAQGGAVAVAKSAETALNRQIEDLPPNMRILPADINETHHLRQSDQADSDFIRSLVQRMTTSLHPQPTAVI